MLRLATWRCGIRPYQHPPRAGALSGSVIERGCCAVVKLYVTTRSMRAHLDPDCELLALVPDWGVRLWHGSCSFLPSDLRYCSRCCRVALAPVHAGLHDPDEPSRGAERPDPEGVDGSVGGRGHGPRLVTAHERLTLRRLIDLAARSRVSLHGRLCEGCGVTYDDCGPTLGCDTCVDREGRRERRAAARASAPLS
jgi:hypothetical protein